MSIWSSLSSDLALSLTRTSSPLHSPTNSPVSSDNAENEKDKHRGGEDGFNPVVTISEMVISKELNGEGTERIGYFIVKNVAELFYSKSNQPSPWFYLFAFHSTSQHPKNPEFEAGTLKILLPARFLRSYFQVLFLSRFFPLFVNF